MKEDDIRFSTLRNMDIPVYIYINANFEVKSPHDVPTYLVCASIYCSYFFNKING